MASYTQQDKDMIFALDIGTRSIVGMVGHMVKDRFKVLAVESAEYSKRTMLDGQIDDIAGVAALARTVTERLEQRLEKKLERVCVAAAGRALRTQRGVFGIDLPEERTIDAADISEMETGAVGEAEAALHTAEDSTQQFYLVGYTVAQYRLDNYPLTTLQGHSGKHAEAEVVATFLPSEVVDSLYSAMQVAGLQVASMTLEPIAAMNAAIPAELRLLNLALVDIGAGTSDIALCRDGSVVGYTMVTLAGDEITETIMKAFLVDFQTAETIKHRIADEPLVSYTNILGLEERVSDEEVQEVIAEPVDRLANAIAQEILSINGGAPSALFLAGGGCKLRDFKQKMAAALGMEEKRVALVGTNFAKSAFADDTNINAPEYATPLGIAISAGMGLLNDSYVVKLNGHTAKLFRSGALNLRDTLLMNGYSYSDLVGKTGQSLTITLDGRRTVYRGEPASPAILKVNGEEASITTLIHAGDSIEFTPAKDGVSVKKTVADILGTEFTGRVMVNQEEVPLTTLLHQGDIVLTLRHVILPPPGTEEPSEEPAVESPEEPSEERIVEPVVVRQEPNVVEAVPQPSQPETVEQPKQSEQKSIQESIETAPSLPNQGRRRESMAQRPKEWPSPLTVLPSPPKLETIPEPTPSVSVKTNHRELNIFFNEKPLVLPEKPSGEPYYLMDLLEYSGIDFKNLNRRVIMEVNGGECGFQTRLQQGDHVLIRPE